MLNMYRTIQKHISLCLNALHIGLGDTECIHELSTQHINNKCHNDI